MKILSIDFDYFLPNTDLYDWGHIENQFMVNFIWQLRVTSINFKTKASAVDEVMPDNRLLLNFFDRVVAGKPKYGFFVCESHSALYKIVKFFNSPIYLTNYDAHHDFGYKNLKHNLITCENWAKVLNGEGLIKEYKLFYPPWRRDDPESKINNKIINVQYGIQKRKNKFDLIFVCRSGAWTPSWVDHLWIDFIERLKGPGIVEDGLKELRSPTINDAKNAIKRS